MIIYKDHMDTKEFSKYTLYGHTRVWYEKRGLVETEVARVFIPSRQKYKYRSKYNPH